VILRQPTREECQQVRLWRNDPAVLPMLRTRTPLTKWQQDWFYLSVVVWPWSHHRYYAIEDRRGFFIGLGGLTHLKRAPGEAEISLILGPDYRGEGNGSRAVQFLLLQAVSLGLRAVVGECYRTGNVEFWLRQLERRKPAWVAYEDSGIKWAWSI
jgi:RimJ/RimL family protein N-acetyltransferase